ncbi:hypothetical protein AB0D33_09690 [Streptomyces sp. NPDC048404]|uniref:hypothetical protein n=1 Tax=unclassified Streptomyces TaxID=2593676 RepID=UPI0034363A1E
MSQTPAPIPAPPSRFAFAGAPVWTSDEAARWSRLRHASWARPLWSVLALLITVVWAIAAAPEPPCTDAVPCGADWVGMVEVGLAVGLLYWLARLPEAALVAAPVLAAVVARVELSDAGPNHLAANLCVLVALGFGWAAARERIVARRRQRDLVERTAGVRHPVPGPVARSWRGTIPVAAGLVLFAVAAFGVVQGLTGIRDDRQHADRAVPVAAKVIDRDDESVRVRGDDGRRLTLDSLYPEAHRVGGTVTVLEDGAWRRLASEPYDAMGPQLAVLAAGLPGLSLLVTGLLARRRAAALRRGPVPVLRVLERMDEDGLVQIYAGDDTAGRRPLLAASFVTDAPDGDERATAHPTDDAHESAPSVGDAHAHESTPSVGDAHESTPSVGDHGPACSADNEDREGERIPATKRPREAVLFGSPCEGGELLLVTTSRDDAPAVLRTSGSVRLPHPGRPASAPEAEAYTATDDVATGVPATLVTTGRPLSWGPSALSRAGGAALALIVIAGVAFNTRTLVTDGIGVKAAVFLLCLLTWLGNAAELLNWRVTADSSGLWLAGCWKVRHVPWNQLRSARCAEDGTARIRMPGGEDWQLPGLGVPKLERRLGLEPSYVRMTREVTTLRRHPELRPVEPAPRRDRGFPLGPVMLAVTVVVALAWALH